jgi:hypothetical protein
VHIAGIAGCISPEYLGAYVIAKMPYYQKPGNDENLKFLLPNNWKKEESNNTLTIL